ncbi:MAG: hypothetical protein HRU27_02925 [Rhizobiaceae bacterium]|nr:hypothetical protein [Hyphomicrobiales bacterium]NRB29534.1 hypothetical protein [Rhizobiaceae bacterium]
MSSLTDLYADDSFFTLTVYGRWGLVVISTLLAGIALWVLWKLTARRSLPVRLLIALGVFIAFEWLAPQLYYLYYLQILENLPWQWVIGLSPPLGDLWDLLIFRERNNLSHHSRAALGWLMLVIALIRPRLS